MFKSSIFICFMSIGLMAYSQSRVEKQTFYSPSLGISKSYNIYLPDHYDQYTDRSYPVIYFLRQHENEWFDGNLRQNGKTLKDILDELIDQGNIGELIIVCPSTGGSTNDLNKIGWGMVNMLRPDLSTDSGMGSGAFEDYFFNDLIPHIDSNFRTIPEWCARGIDGFSLGGYTSMLYTIKHPDMFCSAGSYDGSMMWYNFDYTGSPGPYDDYTWFYPSVKSFVEPMFGQPFDTAYMFAHNPTHILVEANSSRLDSIRQIKFHVSSAAFTQNNLEVVAQFTDTLSALGISNSFSPVVLQSNANHNFNMADEHAKITLPRHWGTFLSHNCVSEYTGLNQIETKEFRIYPNPASDYIVIDRTENQPSDLISVKIINMDGRLVLHNMYSSGRLNVSDLNAGAYIIIIESSASIEHFSLIKF